MNNPGLIPIVINVVLMLATAVPARAQTDASAPASPRDAYETRTVERSDGSGDTYTFRLLTPPEIEPGRLYPLVLFLHGAGERGDDNTSQLAYFPEWMAAPEMQAAYPCFILAPQCPEDEAWSRFSWRRGQAQALGDTPNPPMRDVIDALTETIQTEPVDIRRVYLTGLSMGGYGSWDLAMRHPDWFACVMPICGGGLTTEAHRLTEIPVWAFHGDNDRVVSVEYSRGMIEAIREAGGSPKYTEYEGVNHDSWTPTYTDREVLDWMFLQVNSRETDILDH